MECDYHFDDEIENLTWVANADVVLFHLIPVDLATGMRLLRYRKQGHHSTKQSSQFLHDQIWAIYTAESTDNLKRISKYPSYHILDGIFNWSISFRHDSTISTPYSGFRGFRPLGQTYHEDYYRVQRFQPVDPSKIATKRRHLAAVTSNCHDSYGRLVILEQLKSFGLTVDVYGACSPNNLKCPGRMSSECYEMLEEKYYFYASFENSLCKDYFTEKLLNIFNYDMVPVTINGAYIGQPDKNMPAFIDSKDFTSLKDFAEHLLHIAANGEWYQQFFKWRNHYGIWYDSRAALCHLCMAIQDVEVSKQVPIGNFTDWFLDRSGCHKNSLKM